ncbi:MAG: family 20 glycosylhydrolase [Ignavibacteriae bacterium]|nr:family 20 glycosylhydrolase [Ignavibacteriota bacterium]
MKNSENSIREYLIYLSLIIIYFILSTQLSAKKPATVPAIREWIDYPACFVYTSNSKIVIDKNYFDELYETAQTFSEDLQALKHNKPEIISADSAAESDFFMTLTMKDDSIGKEGYEMIVAENIHISAATSDGIFYGTRTILQMLKNSDSIQGGFARDFPKYPERALMVDIGDNYFSMEWMENQIKELAYTKMNYFHWHISDNLGFRIESTTHPEITSEKHYTKQEIRQLLDLAKKYHVVIVPGIDMPGHMGAILKNHLDEYALKDINGLTCIFFLDIISESSRQFAKEILDEFIELFPGPYWHGGVDEYIYNDFERFPEFLDYAKKIYGNDAKAGDAVIEFVNWLNKIVREKGKTLRIWNDPISKLKNKGGVATVDTNVIIEYWSGDDEPNDIALNGYHISNCSINFLYYNLGTSWIDYNKYLYEKWNPHIFQGEKIVSDIHHKNNGAKFHIWCEKPELETEGHIAFVIRTALKILSQGLWDSPKLVSTLEQFKSIADTIGLAPGVVYPENPIPGNIAFRKKVRVESVGKNTTLFPERITDGDRNTQWQSDIHDTSWMFVDLEDTFKIDKLRITWFHTLPKEFQVQVSNDSVNWFTIKNYIDKSVRIMDINELNAVGRYVRLLLTKTGDSAYYSLWEIEAYGDNLTHIAEKKDSFIKNEKVYPNPFNSEVNIEFYLEKDAVLTIKVFDLNGNELESIFSGSLLLGWHNINWNCKNYSHGEYNILINSGSKSYSIISILMK